VIHLSQEDLRFYEENGYVALRNVVPAEEVWRVRAIMEALVARRAGEERGDFLDLAGSDDGTEPALPQILMPQSYAPELAAGALRATAEAVARALLGDDVFPEGEHSIIKPQSDASRTPLHQDEAFWSGRVDYRSISIWFPLQDVDGENGCLCFVPGSHRTGIVPHHSQDGDVTSNGLEIDHPEQYATVSAPLRVGDCTVHHCRTIHGAGANRTPVPRYAYIYGFGLPACPAAEPRDFPWLEEKRLAREQRAREAGYELTKMRPEVAV
jgi:ectoine hydroxylase-related dioxygenase (phytanoyl-CoA dioxygenase family)